MEAGCIDAKRGRGEKLWNISARFSLYDGGSFIRITAAVVSMCGQIGWIGLLIPHFCRMIYGGSNKDVIPSSIVYGALFLLITDTASRCITASEIPAAILTSLIGAPLFLILLAKNGGLRG